MTDWFLTSYLYICTMEQKKILVVDDEPDLCEILSYNLNNAGFIAQYVHSAEEALAKGVAQYDLLLLDVMMEEMSGFDLARVLKKDQATASIPIVFLTAKDTEEDLLHGFGLGADDYVKKPFSINEVIARVKAVLSRSNAVNGPKTLVFNSLIVDLDKKTVSVDGNLVSLTKTEFELLVLLLQNPGQVFSRQQVIDLVWPDKVVVTDRAVDVNITRMRKKLGPYSNKIVSRQGYGYLFDPDSSI